MKMRKRTKVGGVAILFVVAAFFMAACGGSADTPGEEANSPAATDIIADRGEVQAPTPGAVIPGGWSKAEYENTTFLIPADWKAMGDTGIWCPGDQNMNMGRPAVSLHCGGIPVMPDSSVEDRLKFYYGAVPDTLQVFKRCGMNARFVNVTIHGKRHLGLILEEKTGPMMVLNFFDCQAPEGEFDKYMGRFKRILDSVSCQ